MALPKPYALDEKPKFLKMLLYAPPGVGKTLLAATASSHPAMAKCMLLNIDRGDSTLAPDTPGIVFKNITAVDPGYNADNTRNMGTAQDVEDIVWAVLSGKDGYKGIQTLIIDGITDLQARDLEEIVYHAMKLNPNKHKDRVKDFTERDDYQISTTRLRKVIRMLRDAPLHVIITAWPRVERAKNTNGSEGAIVQIRPDITEKLGNSVEGFMEMVGYLYIDDNKERVMLTHQKGVIRAKTRNMAWQASVGHEVKNPNMPDLYEKFVATKGTK